jgi:hypothetical protein
MQPFKDIGVCGLEQAGGGAERRGKMAGRAFLHLRAAFRSS